MMLLISIRRYIYFILSKINKLHIKKILLIFLVIYALLSLLNLYSSPILGDDSTIHKYIKPLLAFLPYTSVPDSTRTRKKPYPNTSVEAAQLFYKLNFDTHFHWVDKYSLRDNLLTVQYGPKRGITLESVEELEFYDSDPRLSWSVYLNDIMKNGGSNDYTMPFSWYDWADFRTHNKLVSIKDIHTSSLQCSIFFESAFDKNSLETWENKIGELLFEPERVKYADPFWYKSASGTLNDAINEPADYCTQIILEDDKKFNLPVKVLKLNSKVRPEVYQIQARNYLFNNVKNPLSVTMLESDKSSYRIDILQKDRSNMIQSNILQQFIKSREALTDDDIIFDHNEIYQKFLDSDKSKKYKIDIPDIDSSVYEQNQVHLTSDDFNFDTQEKIKELKAIPESELSAHEKNYLESLETSIRTHPVLTTKYFSECTNVLQYQRMGNHRDERFFNGGLILDEVMYANRLNSLTRTLQKFLKSNGLLYWLAHGTLYSHMYNGITFPWDIDFDVQMPIKHLHYLSQYFNQSIILEDPREGNGKFLVDVGTSITVRTNGNGGNSIDARFIDIDSGLYIDITGLSFSNELLTPENEEYFDRELANNLIKSDEIMNPSSEIVQQIKESQEGLAKLDIAELQQYMYSHPGEFDLVTSEYIMKSYDRIIVKPQQAGLIIKDLNETQRFILNEKLGIVNCRNYHHSRLDMISPLTWTMYHGVPALIPHKTVLSLKLEYTVPESYDFTSYKGFAFIPKVNVWIKGTVLRTIANLKHQDKTLFSINSPLTDLRFNDLLGILKNILFSGKYELFSIVHNTFDAVTYRLKELEITFDKELDDEQRQKYLTLLRNNFSGRIGSPGKDPYLYDYERKLWTRFLLRADPQEAAKIIVFVAQDTLKKLWKKYSSLYQHSYFNIPNSEINLNYVGLELLDTIKVAGKGIFTAESS